MTKIPAAVKSAITKFDEACQELAFVGTQPPEIRPEIEDEHAAARQRLENAIAKAMGIPLGS